MAQQTWFEQNAPTQPPPPATGGDWFAQNRPEAASAGEPTREDLTWTDHVGGYFEALKRGLNPFPAMKAVNDSLWRAIDAGRGSGLPEWEAGKSLVADVRKLLSGMGSAQNAVLDRATEAFESGRPGEGARHLVNFMIPILGPGIDEAGNLMQEGRYGEGLGATTALGAQIGGPAALGRMRGGRAGAPLRNPNALERRAVAAAEAEGIPMDLATASGNEFTGGIQRGMDYSPVGGVVGRRARVAQEAALETTAGRLAARTGAGPQTPLTSGRAATAGVQGRVSGFVKKADDSYDALRVIEADPAQARTVMVKQTGTLRGAPVTVKRPITVQMAVDLAESKATLKPLYERLMAEAKISQPQGAKATGLFALDRLMKADDVAPLSVVDGALGDIKAMLRRAKDMEGRRVLSEIVEKLSQEVDGAASRAGPHAVQALREGRKATVARYQAQEVLDGLQVGDVRVFDRLVGRRDTNLAQLQEVAQLSPETIPQIARAYLDDLTETATAKGGFGHTDQLWARWRLLGPETKKILFPGEGHVQALDDFLRISQLIGKKVNPSQSALVHSALTQLAWIYWDPVSGTAAALASGALAKAMRSPRIVDLLTKGLELPAGPTVAKAAWMTELAAVIEQQQRGDQ